MGPRHTMYHWMQNTDGQIEDYSRRYKIFFKFNLNNHFLNVFPKSLHGILSYQHLSASHCHLSMVWLSDGVVPLLTAGIHMKLHA